MSLTERLVEIKARNDDLRTDEDALRQLVFEMISDYLEENDHLLPGWLEGDNDEMPNAGWTDEYAERPLSEPSGYERRTRT